MQNDLNMQNKTTWKKKVIKQRKVCIDTFGATSETCSSCGCSRAGTRWRRSIFHAAMRGFRRFHVLPKQLYVDRQAARSRCASCFACGWLLIATNFFVPKIHPFLFREHASLAVRVLNGWNGVRATGSQSSFWHLKREAAGGICKRRNELTPRHRYLVQRVLRARLVHGFFI